ncbi:MAG: nucleotidyl transferase AbiEii/AbiGii toxin family protein [Candidatus Daviesbacteria bacterium]|nr:nucleotidyl transferase AbiEii/AbiGii toxin family protein [Candidatus Daviesbacteria bacterium]
MSNSTILTKTQLNFLKLLGEQSFSKKFYLSGGTALAGFYIPYRYSEDLDFFSEEEIQVDEIIAFLKSIKDKLGFEDMDFNTSFNRNLFFLKFRNEVLKLEFTYYPFKQLNNSKEEFGIKIDSIEDIAINKLFTIYQNPRSRDFMDLYMIIKKYDFAIEDLIKKAKVKFDWHVDSLKLGTQFLLAEELKDYPNLIEELNEKDWQDFFRDEARKLGHEVIEK